MEENLIADDEPPRFENGKPLLIAGQSERYSAETSTRIPLQWRRFAPHLGHIPARCGTVTYGVCRNADRDGNFDYICGVEVSGFSELPSDWTRLRIPARRYAVFSHHGHISTIRRVWDYILNKWLPEHRHQALDAPNFERYGENFDPATGLGGFEIWIPVGKAGNPVITWEFPS